MLCPEVKVHAHMHTYLLARAWFSISGMGERDFAIVDPSRNASLRICDHYSANLVLLISTTANFHGDASRNNPNFLEIRVLGFMVGHVAFVQCITAEAYLY